MLWLTLALADGPPTARGGDVRSEVVHPTFWQIYQTFGPTYPGDMHDATNTYVLHYPVCERVGLAPPPCTVLIGRLGRDRARDGRDGRARASPFSSPFHRALRQPSRRSAVEVHPPPPGRRRSPRHSSDAPARP